MLLIIKKVLAVRFPKHSLFRNLLKNLDYPLAAPSANISSRLSSVKPSDVKEEFGKKLKYILNGGKSKIGVRVYYIKSFRINLHY